jgi:hypothetical protein
MYNAMKYLDNISCFNTPSRIDHSHYMENRFNFLSVKMNGINN